ncbi:MAG: acyl-CoA thioester hydrolase/BAAT C-terminal domain-containing protein [Polyangiaceae bacterium]
MKPRSRSARGLIGLVAVAMFSGCSDDSSAPETGGAGGGDTGAASVGGAGGAGGAPSEPALLEVRDASTHAAVSEAMFYQPLELVATNLEAGETVVLHAELGSFSSESTFAADADGVVDTSRDAPASGSYTGVDVDGFLWSMSSDASNAQFGEVLSVSLLRNGTSAATANVTRLAVAPGVTKTEVPSSAGFVGVVYTPVEPGPHPVVIGFGGSEGGLWFGDRTAALYASLGYIAVGVAYFGVAGTPSGLTDVPLEYFQSVFDYLPQIEGADPARVAVMGASRGGELALLLGATYPQVSAVVAVVPSGYVWGSASQVNAFGWTLAGVGVPYVPSANANPVITTASDGKPIYALRETFNASIAAATPEELDAATIRVEDTSGPVLLIAGDDDQLWPSCVLGEVARARLESSGHTASFGDELVCYPNSGHFTNPLNAGYPMTRGALSYNAQYGVYFAMGGTAEGLGRAARASFDRVRTFLAESL